MRDPVSIKAVAMMLKTRLLQYSAPTQKNRFGRCNAFESTPPESTLPEGGTIVL